MEKAPGEVWVGWWGIYNHWDDWRDIAPHIEPVIAERPWVKLFVLGMPEVAYLFPRLRASNQLVVGPFVAPEKLGQYRALVKQFDIALAPTAPCAFNESKSDLKVLQYGAAGVPVIASAVTYGEWVKYVPLAERPEDWALLLSRALGNLSRWATYGQQLQEKVLAERTYEGNYLCWLEALS
jgi:hypothetical protein